MRIPIKFRIKKSLYYIVGGAISAAILAALSQCATSSAPIKSMKNIRRELEFEIDSQPGTGTQVAARKIEHTIKIKSEKKPSSIRVTSCHRDVFFKEPDKTFEMHIALTPIELSGFCFLEFAVFSSEGSSRFAIIDLGGPSESIPAILDCNGSRSRPIGTSICQSRVGLTQAISFLSPVFLEKSELCDFSEPRPGLEFLISARSGYCSFFFANSDSDFHRLTIFGYDEVGT